MTFIDRVKRVLLVSTLSTVFSCFSIQAQTCLDSIDNTTPSDIFTDNADGTITDTTTGLVWMRCSIGQVFQASDNQCIDDAQQLTWQQALNMAHGFTFAGADDWRLPNLKELTSLIERQCVRPSINTELFPLTPSDDFWSSTPSLTDPERAWVVAFFNGSNSLREKQLSVFVRLVRNVN
jgi:hypothetical protein